jgi:hypothetical protein
MPPELSLEAKEAIHRAKNAAQAVEISRENQVQSIADIVQERFEHVLSRGTEQEKSIILARVPYICQDIKQINSKFDTILEKMEEVKNDLDKKDEKNESKFLTKEQFGPFRWALMIIGSVVITTVVGSLLANVLIK